MSEGTETYVAASSSEHELGCENADKNDVTKEGIKSNEGCNDKKQGERTGGPVRSSGEGSEISNGESNKINGESKTGTNDGEDGGNQAGASTNSNSDVSGIIIDGSNASASGTSNSGVSSNGGRNRRRNTGRKTVGKRKTRHEAPLSKCIDCQTIDSPFFWLGSDAGEMIGPRCNKCHEIKIALLARRNRKVSRARVENYLNELLDAHGLPGVQRTEETEDAAWLRVIGENYDEATTCREIILDIDELDTLCQFRHIPDLPDAPFKKRPIPLSYDEISLYSYCLKVCPLVARLM